MSDVEPTVERDYPVPELESILIGQKSHSLAAMLADVVGLSLKEYLEALIETDARIKLGRAVLLQPEVADTLEILLGQHAPDDNGDTDS